MKTFENEWLFDFFAKDPTFFKKRMFGGVAAYVHGRQMLVLVEPTKTGRWKWHGVLVCTDHARQAAIVNEFPQLGPHDVLGKWLFLDSRHEEFEPTMERVAAAIARNDPRFGIAPRTRKRRAVSARRRTR